MLSQGTKDGIPGEDMILVTGGAGFIGSYFVKYLNDQGHRNIVIVDRLRSEEKWKNLPGLLISDVIHADKFFESTYFKQNCEIKAIFHFGACSATTEKDADYLLENNYHYSKRLAQWALEKGHYFSYASSAAVYGTGERGFSDSHEESIKLRPINPYGYSKWLFDEWMIDHFSTQVSQAHRWHGHRFFNVFGPNEYHKGKMRSVVLQAFEQTIAKDEVKLFKSYHSQYVHGEQMRDFIYVDDVARAMYRMWQQSDVSSGIYNLGTGKARSFNDLAKATFQALNKRPNIVYIDMPVELRNQYQYFTQASTGKLLNSIPDFGFRSLEDSIKDYVQNYLLKGNERAISILRGAPHGQHP